MKRFLVLEGPADYLEKELNKYAEDYDVVSFTKMSAPRKLAIILKLKEDYKIGTFVGETPSLDIPEDMALIVDSLVVRGKNLKDMFNENNKSILLDVHKMVNSLLPQAKNAKGTDVLKPKKPQQQIKNLKKKE